MRLGTHDGSFHADDCCAVAVVQLAHPDEAVEVIRTRDEEQLAACDLRIDVGFRHDPATGDFDHHQAGGAGKRVNGVPYASFGLVWAHYGPAVCERLGAGADPAVLHARIDETLVAAIDANDVGVAVSAPAFDGAPPPYGLASVIGALNPSWDEPAGEDEQRRAFEDAVALARRTLEREIAGQASGLRAEAIVRDAIESSADPRIVELGQNVPWVRPVHEHAPDALYIVYPKTKGWAVEAVRITPERFETRKPLPESWAGLQADDLIATSGVPDAIFCHAARFLARAGSREGAMALAQAALRA